MDETPALRRAVADDAAAVRVLTREAYAKWVTVIGREPLPMRPTMTRRCGGTASTSPFSTAALQR